MTSGHSDRPPRRDPLSDRRRDCAFGARERSDARAVDAGVGPVPNDARQLGDERLDRDGRQGRRDDSDRNSGRDHGVHARHGRADDHWSQDRRDHRAEARLRDRLCHLRLRLVHDLDRPEPSGTALRLVVPRGRRRSTDPARDRPARGRKLREGTAARRPGSSSAAGSSRWSPARSCCSERSTRTPDPRSSSCRCSWSGSGSARWHRSSAPSRCPPCPQHSGLRRYSRTLAARRYQHDTGSAQALGRRY